MNNEFLTREDLTERVTLPMGSIANVLNALLSGQNEIHPVALEMGLLRVQATVTDIHEFLLGMTQTTEERREPRTPEQLREFVAEKTAWPKCEVVQLPLRQLGDVHETHFGAKGQR